VTRNRNQIRSTPFHVSGGLFLFAGLLLAAYHGLAQFDVVPDLGWVSWSHIHFVTIGGFTQLLFGTLPQLAARKLERPPPARRYDWLNLVGLNGGFLLLWYGRGWGKPWAFDVGLFAIWLLVAGLFVVILRMALQSEGAWDATIGLYLVSVFVFLWGITYAYGLYAHVWQVPGGWLGLREAHVHANAWGFLGLAAIGTLSDLFPRLLDTDLYSERLRNYSAGFLVVGIFPLITGPWIGLGRTVTATGLVLFATGFALYLYNLVRTYRSSDVRSGIATALLGAQFWMLGPAGFAPFVLFGVEWVDPAFIEDGALHFFFVGWALPIALAGLLLFVPNLAASQRDRNDSGERTASIHRPTARDVPSVLAPWTVGLWNIAILVVGVGFFYQNQPWAAFLFGPGYLVILGLWLYQLGAAARLRWAARTEAGAATEAGL